MIASSCPVNDRVLVPLGSRSSTREHPRGADVSPRLSARAWRALSSTYVERGAPRLAEGRGRLFGAPGRPRGPSRCFLRSAAFLAHPPHHAESGPARRAGNTDSCRSGIAVTGASGAAWAAQQFLKRSDNVQQAACQTCSASDRHPWAGWAEAGPGTYRAFRPERPTVAPRPISTTVANCQKGTRRDSHRIPRSTSSPTPAREALLQTLVERANRGGW